MSVEIFDFGQSDVKVLSEFCEINFCVRAMTCDHSFYDIVRGQIMESQNGNRNRTLVCQADACEETLAEFSFCVCVVLV